MSSGGASTAGAACASAGASAAASAAGASAGVSGGGCWPIASKTPESRNLRRYSFVPDGRPLPFSVKNAWLMPAL